MLVLFKRGVEKQPHIIIDSQGGYHGICPSLMSAREATEVIMSSKNPPPTMYIYKAILIDQSDRPITIKLSGYQSSV